MHHQVCYTLFCSVYSQTSISRCRHRERGQGKWGLRRRDGHVNVGKHVEWKCGSNRGQVMQACLTSLSSLCRVRFRVMDCHLEIKWQLSLLTPIYTCCGWYTISWYTMFVYVKLDASGLTLSRRCCHLSRRCCHGSYLPEVCHASLQLTWQGMD